MVGIGPQCLDSALNLDESIGRQSLKAGDPEAETLTGGAVNRAEERSGLEAGGRI